MTRQGILEALQKHIKNKGLTYVMDDFHYVIEIPKQEKSRGFSIMVCRNTIRIRLIENDNENPPVSHQFKKAYNLLQSGALFDSIN